MQARPIDEREGPVIEPDGDIPERPTMTLPLAIASSTMRSASVSMPTAATGRIPSPYYWGMDVSQRAAKVGPWPH